MGFKSQHLKNYKISYPPRLHHGSSDISRLTSELRLHPAMYRCEKKLKELEL